MPSRTSKTALIIVVWVLLSGALDVGRSGGQAPADRTGTGGRQWMPMPFFPPGASVVLLLGDPFREAGYMYVRFPAAYEPPLHSHHATERIAVDQGTLILHIADRDPIREPPGSYLVIHRGTVHATTCAGPDDCFCYISVDRAFDVIPFPKRD